MARPGKIALRNRVKRQLFSPRNKRPYHKAVGFAESGRGSRSGDPQDETPILTELTEELDSVLAGKDQRIGTDSTHEHEGESNLIGNEHLLKTLRELESIRALRGVNSGGSRTEEWAMLNFSGAHTTKEYRSLESQVSIS